MAKGEIISCVACGHDVAKSAKACPNCGAKPSKGFGKTFNGKLLKWIIILYIFIGVDFILFDRAMPNSSSDGSNTESISTEGADIGAPTEDNTGVLDNTQPVGDTGVTDTTPVEGDGVNADTTQADVPVTDAGDATNTDATLPTDTTQTTTP